MRAKYIAENKKNKYCEQPVTENKLITETTEQN